MIDGGLTKELIMQTDLSSNAGNERRIALLIDADNVSHTKVAAMLAELSKYGTANILSLIHI